MKCPRCQSDQTQFDGTHALRGGSVEFNFYVCRDCGIQFVENPEDDAPSEKPHIPTREELLKKIRWQHEIDNARQVKVDKLLTTPTLKTPPLYKSLREVIQSGIAGPKDYDAFLSEDPALCEKLLALVNSPMYGLDPKVQTVVEVFKRLEPDEVAGLVLGIETLSTLAQPSALPVAISHFWSHGITCGLAARGIGQFLGLPNPNSYFIAGLLVDIGRFAIADQSPEVAIEIHNQSQKTQTPLIAMEDQLLEFNHSQVGESLIKEWMEIDWVAQAIRYHHHPREAKRHQQAACILHVSDVIAYDLKMGSSGESVLPEVDSEAVKMLGITRSLVQSLKQEIRPLTQQLQRILIDKNPISITDSTPAP